MADNVTLPGTSEIVAADDIGSSVKVQRTKTTWGPDGTANDADIASGKPLPIQVRTATGLIPFGLPTDAKSAATDTTDVGITALLKQLNHYLQSAIAGDYETVAASQTDQSLGATGATGDYLEGVLIIPGTTSPGAVSIKDGAGGAISIFTGGTSSVLSLHPFFVALGIKSTAGAWKVTTGAAVTAIGVGKFT